MKNFLRARGALLILTGLTLVSAGCAGKGSAQQDPGTSTGLPYRASGQPVLVDVPAQYPVYANGQPLRR